MLLIYLNAIKSVGVSIHVLVHNLDDCCHFTTYMTYFLILLNYKKCCVKSLYFVLCRCNRKCYLYLCFTCRKTVIYVNIISYRLLFLFFLFRLYVDLTCANEESWFPSHNWKSSKKKNSLSFQNPFHKLQPVSNWY